MHLFALCRRRLPIASLLGFRRPYTRVAHQHLVRTFGANRTALVCGDSGDTIPAWAASIEAADRFDAMFIDGGHVYSQALADLRNSRGSNTLLVATAAHPI